MTLTLLLCLTFPNKDLDASSRIDGTWIVVQVFFDDESHQQFVGVVHYVIKDGILSIKHEQQGGLVSQCTVRATKLSPTIWAVDWYHYKTQHWKGLAYCKGDKLIFCMNQRRESARPKRFKGSQAIGSFVTVLSRLPSP